QDQGAATACTRAAAWIGGRAVLAAGCGSLAEPRRSGDRMSAPAAASDRRRISRFALFVHRSRAVPYLLLLPCAAWIALFFMVPLALMTWRSLAHDGFSTAIYAELMTSPQYAKVTLTSLKIVTLTTVATLLIGYPIAYAIT